jgi:hypothetical protein
MFSTAFAREGPPLFSLMCCYVDLALLRHDGTDTNNFEQLPCTGNRSHE